MQFSDNPDQMTSSIDVNVQETSENTDVNNQQQNEPVNTQKIEPQEQ